MSIENIFRGILNLHDRMFNNTKSPLHISVTKRHTNEVRYVMLTVYPYGHFWQPQFLHCTLTEVTHTHSPILRPHTKLLLYTRVKNIKKPLIFSYICIQLAVY